MTDALASHHGPAPEALCRRYLGGAARDGQWPFRIVRGKERFPASVALSGPERGTWTNETTGRQGGLLDLIRLAGKHENLSGAMMAARDFLDAEHHRLSADLSPHAAALLSSWRQAGRPMARGRTRQRTGLLDLIGHTAAAGDIIQAMDAARAFLEAQRRQQHKMAQDLEQKQTKHKNRGRGMSL